MIFSGSGATPETPYVRGRVINRQRRHPAEVISDRLGDASSKWADCFTPAEKDAISWVRHALEEIAEGKR